MPRASARIAARTAALSSSAPARSPGRSLAGRHHRVGGWGFPVSDEGSGAWLGCEVVRRVLWAHDGRAPWTGLLRGVFEQFNSDPHAIVRWMGSARPREFASARTPRRPACAPGRPGGLRAHAACRGTYRCAGRAARRHRRAAVGVGRRPVVEHRPVARAGDEAPPGSGRGRCARGCSVARSGRGPVRGADELTRKVIVSMAKNCRSDADVTMAREIREAPAAVSRQLQGLARALGGACRPA